MGFQLMGFQFHFYGLVLGLAGVAGILLAEKLVNKNGADHQLAEKWFWRFVTAIFLGGVIGARLYHVWTDWSLYQSQPEMIWQIWNGGLSIIGAFIGGVIGVCVVSILLEHSEDAKNQPYEFLKRTVLFFVDVGVLCLPISQAIGRFGNFLNQELYGYPTTLPWGIYIDSAHRISGYEGFSRFHPLFAYEAIGMLVLAAVLWWIEKKGTWKLGSGKFTLAYLTWYGFFRSALETLRIEKTPFMATGLGLNQVILLGVGVCSGIALLRMILKGKSTSKKTVRLLPVFLVLVFASCVFTACQSNTAAPAHVIASPSPLRQDLLIAPDHVKKTFTFRRQATSSALPVTFEVVNSRESIQQGLSDREALGSDGMLFVFPTENVQRFWMIRMKFDLDMVWISENKIVGITTDVPKPASDAIDPKLLPTYLSPQAIDMVLEIPAGTAKTWQLQTGDALE